jgi:tetratricopeptide (TPR) repeat protein
MRPMSTAPLRALWIATSIVAGFWTEGARGFDHVSALQVMGKPAEPANQQLEAALRKIREGRIDEAVAIIKQEEAKHGDWPPAQVVLARLLFTADQAANGRRALEKAATETPNHPEVFLMFGTLALADNRYNDAQLNIEHALRLVASGKWDDEKTRFFRREAAAGLAAVAEARSDWKTTQDHLNAWLELEPKNGMARQRLGRVLFQLGKSEDAFAALTQAVKDEPRLDPASVSMASLFSQKGNLKKAQEWFDYAQKAEPSNARVRVAHATWLFNQGRAAAALPEVEEALKLDPKSQDAQRLRGLISWHLRDLSGAEAILDPLHRDTPTDGLATNLLALALVEQDDPVKRARGLQLADTNARQMPRSHEALSTLGWAHYRSGHLDEAEKILRSATTGTVTLPDNVYFLARVLADKGRLDDARKLLQSATSQPGAFAHRDDASALLKSLTK